MDLSVPRRDVVGLSHNLGHDDANRSQRQCSEQSRDYDRLGGISGLGVNAQGSPSSLEQREEMAEDGQIVVKHGSSFISWTFFLLMRSDI
jgi:hypothetical protein